MLERYSGTVNIVAFSPDGSFAITCDQQGSIFLWQTKGGERGKLFRLYVPTYEVGAVLAGRNSRGLSRQGRATFSPVFLFYEVGGVW